MVVGVPCEALQLAEQVGQIVEPWAILLPIIAMFLNRTALGAALLAAVGLPYVLSTQKTQPPPASGLPEDFAVAGAGPTSFDAPARLAAVLPGAGLPGKPAGPGDRHTPPTNLEEILRFDLTPEQVIHTWPMVTTTTNQPELKGYRVPLVTGNRPESLAGSLTYYFNGQQELQRIVFHGTTGEPRPLIQLMVQKFEFKNVSDADAGAQRYQVRFSGRVVSELRVQPAQIVDNSQPHRRFAINLSLERPQKIHWFKGERSPVSDLRL
jgi:hypothetical protein